MEHFILKYKKESNGAAYSFRSNEVSEIEKMYNALFSTNLFTDFTLCEIDKSRRMSIFKLAD